MIRAIPPAGRRGSKVVWRVADAVFLGDPVVAWFVIETGGEDFGLLVLSEFDPVSWGEFVGFVGVGVGVGLGADALSLLSFCLTTNESNSGNHFGQGHAAAKVERKQSSTRE